MKARYVGVGRGCGAYTVPRNGKGDAYAYCKRCHSGAIGRHWTQERVVEAMLDWRRRYRAPLDAGAGGRGDAGLAPSLPGATGRRSGGRGDAGLAPSLPGATGRRSGGRGDAGLAPSLPGATGRRSGWSRRCWTGAVATGRHWTQERVVEAMLDWRRRYGRLPSSYDWSRTHARGRGGEALKRLTEGEWPAASVVSRVFGAWAAAGTAAGGNDRKEPTRWALSPVSALGSNSISLPTPRESTAKSVDLRGGKASLQQADLQAFSFCGMAFAHNSSR